MLQKVDSIIQIYIYAVTLCSNVKDYLLKTKPPFLRITTTRNISCNDKQYIINTSQSYVGIKVETISQILNL